MSFPSTHWSLIGAVRGEKSPQQHQALEVLSALYRRPAYQHVLGKGYSPADAEDLVQEFFADWLERELFGQADRTRGRFRSFFLTVLDNFIAKSWRRAHAQRRYPEGGFAADDLATASGGDSPEDLFWRAFAGDLISGTLVEVAAGLEARGMQGHVQAFRAWIVEPILDGAERPSQRALAATLGVSEKQFSNMLITVRRDFRKRLETKIRDYAADEDDVAMELKELMGYAGFGEEG